MLTRKIQDALNRQMNRELFSAYLYLSMAAYFESLSLPGFANWMKIQIQEETFHGMKFFGYINERDGRALMQDIEAPETQWESPRAAFEHVLNHEQIVSSLINDLVDLSIEKKDHATNSFLQWFVNEQIEEESSANDVLQKIKLAGDGAGLFMLDQQLGQRIFTPPAAEAT
jgi:ferritin